MASKLVPLHDRVVVEEVKSADKIGSIFIPDAAQTKSFRGIVIAIGPGKRDNDGDLRPLEGIAIGDLVIYGKYSGTDCELSQGGRKLLSLAYTDILGVVVEDEGPKTVRAGEVDYESTFVGETPLAAPSARQGVPALSLVPLAEHPPGDAMSKLRAETIAACPEPPSQPRRVGSPPELAAPYGDKQNGEPRGLDQL